MVSRGRLLTLICVTSLGVVLGIAVAGAGASPANDGPPPAGPEVMGIRVPVALGTPPTSDAFARTSGAKALPGYASAAKATSATYVLFSYDSYFTELPDGTRQYRFQNVPAWLVTYSGLDLPSHGGYNIVNHEYNVVVDVKTGEPIWEFSYR